MRRRRESKPSHIWASLTRTGAVLRVERSRNQRTLDVEIFLGIDVLYGNVTYERIDCRSLNVCFQFRSDMVKRNVRRHRNRILSRRPFSQVLS